jgi:hypothetical protein
MDEGRTKLLSLEADGAAALDYSDMDKLTKSNISIPTGALDVEVTQYVTVDGTEHMLQNYRASSDLDVRNVIRLFHAPAFKSYRTNTTMFNTKSSDLYNESGDKPMTGVTKLSTQITNVVRDENVLSLDFSGDPAEFVRAISSQIKVVGGIQYADSRMIFFPFKPNAKFHHPKIPTELIGKYQPIGEMKNFNRILVGNYEDSENYEEFVANYLEKSFSTHSNDDFIGKTFDLD